MCFIVLSSYRQPAHHSGAGVQGVGSSGPGGEDPAKHRGHLDLPPLDGEVREAAGAVGGRPEEDVEDPGDGLAANHHDVNLKLRL